MFWIYLVVQTICVVFVQMMVSILGKVSAITVLTDVFVEHTELS